MMKALAIKAVRLEETTMSWMKNVVKMFGNAGQLVAYLWARLFRTANACTMFLKHWQFLECGIYQVCFRTFSSSNCGKVGKAGSGQKVRNHGVCTNGNQYRCMWHRLMVYRHGRVKLFAWCLFDSFLQRQSHTIFYRFCRTGFKTARSIW